MAEQVLGPVRVLVFIDEQVLKALLVGLQNVRVAVELAHDLDEQVVEIKGLVAAQFALVIGVEFGDLPLVLVCLAREFQRVEHGVLGAADLADDRARGEVALVDLVSVEDAADGGTAVVFVVDGEVGI